MVIEYETIHNILARYNNKELGKYDKVNFYGVITHVSQSDRSKGKTSYNFTTFKIRLFSSHMRNVFEKFNYSF